MRHERPPELPAFMITAPSWLVLVFASSLMVNAFATALLATALVLHIAGKLP